LYFWALFLLGNAAQPLESIRAIAERVAQARGLEVWDIQSRRESVGHVVRIFIDRPGPAATPEESVSVEDCEQVNRELSTILDVEDPLPFTYVLEVSSPGLDRPLRGADDYARFAGRLAKVVVSEAVDNQKAFEGRLRGVENDAVVLEAPNGRIHRLPLTLITRGRLEVEF
jgi:ribosome maturation factor RimP